MKLKLIIKINLFLFFSFFFLSNSFAENNRIYKINLPNNIEIILPQSKIKKYLENLINAKLDGDTIEKKNIRRKYRKWWNAEVIIKSNNKNKIIKSKVRLMGDWKDHIRLPHSSLKVKLYNDTINGIKNFRLLLPETRFGNKEIFFTIVLRELGFAAPETKFIDVKTNFGEYKAIFQEDPEKEFLERNNYFESPVIKQNEYIFEWSKNTKKFLKNVQPYYGSYIIDNKNFLKKSNSELTVSNAITLMQKIRFNEKLKYKFIHNEKAFEEIMKKYAPHGINNGWHNRRFIYDSILFKFHPLYHDGMVEYKSLQDFDVKKCIKSELLKTINKIENEYYLKANKKLSKKEKCIIADIFKIFNENKDIEQKNFSPIHKLFEKKDPWEKYKKELIEAINNKQFANNFSQNGARYTFVYEQKNYECYFDLKYRKVNFCKNINLKKYKKLISNNTKIRKVNKIEYPTINLGNLSLDQETKKNINFLNLNDKKDIDITINLTKGKMNYVFRDVNNKKININFFDLSSRVIFLSDISNSIINISATSRKSIDLSAFDRTNQYMITGCTTFYKNKLINTKIFIKNMNCEDSINFLQSNGKYLDLKIEESFSDGLDADFSELNFKNIDVNISKNDCIDFSFGTYIISKSNISNCGDKGISIGETSIVSILNTHIDKSPTSLAVKDSAILNLKNSYATNTKFCLQVYKKKEEFESGVANITNFKCQAKYTKDKNGIINIHEKN